MDSIRPSESLPSVHSDHSLGGQSALSYCESEHLLAYLRKDSMRSMASIGSLDPKEDRRRGLDRRMSSNESQCGVRNAKSPVLRLLANAEPSPVSKDTPCVTTSQPHMLVTRRRPPPLKLDRGRHISTKPNVVISRDASPVAHPIRGHELDQLSPWLLLDRFPTPPSSAPIIQGSKSTVGLSRILRYGGNTEDASVIPSTPKHHRKDQKVQDENVPSTPGLSKKKRHASFSSLGKAFRSTSNSPSTPLPSAPPSSTSFATPDSQVRPSPLSDKEGEGANPPSFPHRRNTFKSKLFSIAKVDGHCDGGRKLPNAPTGPLGSRHGIRAASDSKKGMAGSREEAKLTKPRSQSVSQSTRSRAHGSNKYEPETPARDNIWFNKQSPITQESQLVIPERRTRSPSYINLYVPPRRQASLSPTQSSFAAAGGMTSAPTTPIGGIFDPSDEIMHLPASRSVRSLRVELDPFGAGEPDSFFRSEYEQDWDTSLGIERDAIDFYKTIRAEAGAWKKRQGLRPSRRAIKHTAVPEIVVSPAEGLKGLKQRS